MDLDQTFIKQAHELWSPEEQYQTDQMLIASICSCTRSPSPSPCLLAHFSGCLQPGLQTAQPLFQSECRARTRRCTQVSQGMGMKRPLFRWTVQREISKSSSRGRSQKAVFQNYLVSSKHSTSVWIPQYPAQSDLNLRGWSLDCLSRLKLPRQL